MNGCCANALATLALVVDAMPRCPRCKERPVTSRWAAPGIRRGPICCDGDACNHVARGDAANSWFASTPPSMTQPWEQLWHQLQRSDLPSAAAIRQALVLLGRAE